MADHQVQLSNGLQLGYAEHGDPNGEVMFYFHGWPSARVQAELMHETALKHGIRLISPDRPGIGLSDFQTGRKLSDWPGSLLQLAEHVGAEKFHLLGWSGGGPYVLVTAHALPERVLSATVCCGAPPLRFLGFQHLFWVYKLMIHLRSLCPPLLGLVLRLGKVISSGEPDRVPLKWMISMMGKADREVLRRPDFFRVIRSGILEALKRGPKAVVADADIYLSEWGFEVGSIKCLVHFWHGKEDRNISWKYSEQLSQLMPHVTTRWIEGDGHYSLPIVHVEKIMAQALENVNREG